MRAAGIRLTALVATLAVPAAAHADSVVVRASGPSAAKYPLGRKIAANTQIRLEAGDVVTVLDRVGTRVLKGKGDFTLDGKVARDAGIVAMLSRSLSNPAAVRAGAVRGVARPVQPASMQPRSIWLANIDRGGKLCVPQGSGAYLWRDASDAGRVSWLGEAEGGATVRISFPTATSGVAWPTASLPLITGRRYTVTDEGKSDAATEFEVVSLAPDSIPADAAELGSLLLANGCTAQFEALADTLGKVEEVAADN